MPIDKGPEDDKKKGKPVEAELDTAPDGKTAPKGKTSPKSKTAPKAAAKNDSAPTGEATAKDKDPKTDQPGVEDALEAASETAQDGTSETAPDQDVDAPEIDADVDPDVEGAHAHNDFTDSLRHDEPHHEEEHGSRSLAATALMVLVGVIFVASLSLWLAPKLAPNLPEGVAKYLLPGQVDTENRLAALDEALAKQAADSQAAITTLKADVVAVSDQLGTASATLVEEAQATAEAANAQVAGLTARIETIDAEMRSLREEFSAVSSALADAGDDGGPSSPELAAAIAALGKRLDNLSGFAERATADRTAITARLDAVEASTADARNVQTEALGEVSSAIHQARLESAIDLLNSRLSGGLPYAAKLAEITSLTGDSPPEALVLGAEAGLATPDSLDASFARFAQAAVTADVRANAGDGSGFQALGWLRAQIAGRPVSEQEGADVGATTSRIAARVEEGKLPEALAEAESMPEHARTGLGRWLEQLRARVNAEIALAEWRSKIGAGG